MLLNDWLELKSGSDVRGVALEGVAGEPVNLTDEAIRGVCEAFLVWFAKNTGKTSM